jgi:hypothetical protein
MPKPSREISAIHGIWIFGITSLCLSVQDTYLPMVFLLSRFIYLNGKLYSIQVLSTPGDSFPTRNLHQGKGIEK